MKLSRPVTHVLFDLDGVLLDTERLYTIAAQRVLEPEGIRYDWSLKLELMGRAALESARILVERTGTRLDPEEYLRRRDAELRRLLPGAEPIEGAPEWMRLLAQQEVPMAIATSTGGALFEEKRAAHGDWLGLARVVVCGDDPELQRPKPAPDIFLLAARRLGAEPSRCVVFEDSPAGVAAGAAAGMQVVALVDPGVTLERYTVAEFVVRGYDELRLEDLGF